MHIDIILDAIIHIGEFLIWRSLPIRQITKLKSSPKFPVIRYNMQYIC